MAGTKRAPARSARSAAAEERMVRKCKGLIYGPPKHGKTRFLGTAVFDKRTTPIAIGDFDGGVLDVLEGLPGQGKDWVHFPLSSWDDANEFYAEMEENSFGFKALGFDSLSEFHIFTLMARLADQKSKREDKGHEVDLVQQDDYGIAMVQLRRYVKALIDLPLHIIFTAHSKEEADTREGLVKMPKMAGQLATEIPGMMSLVGYLALFTEDDGSTARSLLLQNYAKVRTGVRTAWDVVAPDEVEDPTMTAVLDALKYSN